jgi:hypothetical protein
MPESPLNVLCLDGGGCRAIMQLILLMHLLQQVEPTKDAATLRPCQYFDLICGTSSGGCLALMLGRLGMSVGEAMDAFDRFVYQIYGKGADLAQLIATGNLYRLKGLEDAVDALLQGYITQESYMQSASSSIPHAAVSRPVNAPPFR